MEEMRFILDKMRAQGWRITEKEPRGFRLPDPLRSRYPRLPADLEKFLAGIEQCVNQENNVWILCQTDYEGRIGSAWAWNDFEQMSLDAAGDDIELASQIRAFWNVHFPFYMSVAGEYSYCAVSLAPDNFGTVVEGWEPEFEDVSVVAGSFSEFIASLVRVR